MYTPRQIWHHVTPKAQLLIALALATVLAFSAGLAAGIYGRATSLPALTTDRNAVPAVAQPPQAAPAVRQGSAVPAPATGAGSAYDGGHYGSPVMPPQTWPNVPAIGTGSVYDGGHYGSSTAAPLTSPNVPISGTGSAYDGSDYRLVRTMPLAPINPNVPISGTGSAYD
ncbi:MAG TPA: hypothetical protein VFO07_11290, partial [Roseiflexaceae bacterium]|nr:hypothetical protein [Roseiflexaceae bacterium]